MKKQFNRRNFLGISLGTGLGSLVDSESNQDSPDKSKSSDEFRVTAYQEPKSILCIPCRNLRSITTSRDYTSNEYYAVRWETPQPEEYDLKVKIEQRALDEVVKYNGSNPEPLKSARVSYNKGEFEVELGD